MLHCRFLMPTNKKETDVKMLWHWFGCGTNIHCMLRGHIPTINQASPVQLFLMT